MLYTVGRSVGQLRQRKTPGRTKLPGVDLTVLIGETHRWRMSLQPEHCHVSAEFATT